MFEIRPASQRLRFRAIAILAIIALSLSTGCKTSDDAAAAATQMSATAKSLCDYYTTLGTILSNTDQVYILNQQIQSKPYSDENRQLMKDSQTAITKRAQLAEDFSTFAGEFAKLSGSTASADASASADKLASEVESLASVKASSTEQEAMKIAVKLLTQAIQEHKEREAAKAIEDFSKGLTALFVKEKDAFNSIETNYTSTASHLATYLVDHNGTDQSAMLKPALDPFGLTPATPSADLKAALVPLAEQQITARMTSQDEAYLKATDAMAKSLQEMSDRVQAVADGKPMSFRMPPLTLATVEKWATQVQTSTPSK